MLSFLLSIEGIRATFSLLLISILFIVQLTRKELNQALVKKILIATFVGIGILVLYEGRLLLSFWENNELTKFLLPPYQDFTYFAFRFFKYSFLPWVVAALGGLFLSWSANRLNAKYGERFFEREEITLFALAAFMTGYPGILFYVFLILLTELLLIIVYTLAGWGRAPMYYLWLPVALFVMIMMYQIPTNFIKLFLF